MAARLPTGRCGEPTPRRPLRQRQVRSRVADGVSPHHTHVNPLEGTKATAPYNFVPLPRAVYTPDEAGQGEPPWKRQDRWDASLRTGWIDLELTTLTPLFVRGPARKKKDGKWDERDARLRPEPYRRADGRGTIPGSTLRGATRTLVEILSFSKVQPVTDRTAFFRNLGSDRVARKGYAPQVTNATRVAGFLWQDKRGEWWLKRSPAFMGRSPNFLRVHHELLTKRYPGFSYGDKASYAPADALHDRPVWVLPDPNQKAGGRNDGEAYVVQDIHPHDGKPRPGKSWLLGVLVLTGWAGQKRHEFVFLARDGEKLARTRVAEGVVDRFQSDDQVTRWQRDAFPAQPPDRSQPGHIRPNEPVFATLRDGEVVGVGRASAFRISYDQSPNDLIPKRVCAENLDLAEAMFGVASESDDGFRGRVRFEDAVTREPAEPVPGLRNADGLMVPRVLGSPRATYYPSYLTQPSPPPPNQLPRNRRHPRAREQARLRSYLKDDADETTIRGHKLYWHRWDDETQLENVKWSEDTDEYRYPQLLKDMRRGGLMQDDKERTQETLIEPIRAGSVFHGRVHFENLTDVELGALLHALQLPEGCAHRIGQAKPLGLGSVGIETALWLVNHKERHGSWSDAGVHSDGGMTYRGKFEEAIKAHAASSDESQNPNKDGLASINRLHAMFTILDWATKPTPDKTAQMDVKKFRHKPVLPGPDGVDPDSLGVV